MNPTSSNHSSEERVTILPNSIENMKSEFFKDLSTYQILRICAKSKFRPSTSRQAVVAKYSGSALCLGRPLDTVMVLMAGASGAGKSSTVNELFGDKELCKTSSLSSETNDVTMVRKLLNVTAENPTVSGYLSFVDVPGTFDTDSSNEAPNMACIRKLKTCRAELADRPGYSKYYTGIREHVYPNVVLFVVKATENRLEGKDSSLARSLKVFRKTASFVDSDKHNVIVVLTHVMMLPRKKETWLAKINATTVAIQAQFKTILGISNVEVVPVENEPEEYDLEKKGDFYMLPDEQLSHRNLFEAMLRLFDNSGDLLGRMLTCWYFKGNCPEIRDPAEKINIADFSQLAMEEIAQAAEILDEHISVPSTQLRTQPKQNEMIPIYHIQRLARGYCPVTEEFKLDMPLESLGELRAVKIGNSNFSIPQEVSVNPIQKTSFHLQSFMEKAEYQEHMQRKYGLAADLKLVVNVSSNGRWINSGVGSSSTSLISMVHETQLATLSLMNPGEKELSPTFSQELNNLPNTYTEETMHQYLSFFSRWGTHLVVQQAVGGSVELETHEKRASLSPLKLTEVETQASGILRNILGGQAEYIHSSELKRLKAIGVSTGNLRITGGTQPGLITLDSVTPELLERWVKTVSEHPEELSTSIKLYPYTNFLQHSPQQQALHEATRDFLSNTLSSRIEQTWSNTRGEIGDREIKKTVKKSWWICNIL